MFSFTDDSRSGVDLFFSFATCVGPPHIDEECIFLLGLKGSTIYKDYLNRRDYIVEKVTCYLFQEELDIRLLLVLHALLLQ